MHQEGLAGSFKSQRYGPFLLPSIYVLLAFESVPEEKGSSQTQTYYRKPRESFSNFAT